jgi:adenylate cyclase
MGPMTPLAPDGPIESRRVLRRAMIGMLAANFAGAVVVFALIRWILPLPKIDPDAASANGIVFAAYMLATTPIGIAWSLRRYRPVRRWLEADRDPTPEEQRMTLRAPLRQVTVNATMWAIGGVIFVAFNLQYSTRLALDIAITVALGAATTCTLSALLLERIDRPIFARALRSSAPEELAVPGVRMRLLLVWALCSGVPALGVVLLGGSQVLGLLSASADRIAASAVFLAGIVLIVGLTAAVLAARSVAEPVEEVRGALAAVRRGDTDVELDVYDGSEIGLLQAGFNQMVDGLRERERLRDLFGRQVGEDVAREALERGTELGGETREVAALFVDLVGSTDLAATRPAHEVVEILNEFFCVVVAVVGEHGGFVNKFEGDAALCVFGAPLEREDAPGDALKAARELRRRLAEELPHCDLGIGVSWGTAVAGNIGAAERFEYTVIGDPVNEAARLTELAKQHPGRILASGAALAAARDGEVEHWTRERELVLRGRHESTEIAAPRK